MNFTLRHEATPKLITFPDFILKMIFETEQQLQTLGLNVRPSRVIEEQLVGRRIECFHGRFYERLKGSRGGQS